MSVIFFASAAGMIITAPLVQWIIVELGWRSAWLVLAVNMFVLGAIPCLIFIRRSPEDLGLEIDGGNVYSPDGVATSVADDEVTWDMREVVRTFSFWAILASLFIAAICTSGVGLHLIPYLVDQNIAPGIAVSVISVMSISGAVSAIVLGVLSERVSPRFMMGSIYLLAALSLVVLLNTNIALIAYGFAILNGIVGVGVNTLAPILWAKYYGRDSVGSIYGVSRSVQVMGFAIGPLASGLVYDTFGSYEKALTWFAVVSLLSVVLIGFARRPVKIG